MLCKLGFSWLAVLCGSLSLVAQTNQLNLAAIGGATPAGSVANLTNGVDLTAGGSDIGGASDQFEFDSQPQTGDFDVEVRLQGLTLSSAWAKAGLMARATLDPASPFAAALSTPSLAGAFFETRGAVGGSAVLSGAFPANYPNTWLRLKRAGELYTGFASFDGSNWVQLGTGSLSGDPVYLGLAVSAGSANQAALAQFRGYGTVAGGTTGSFTSPSEPLGPCTRKTELVFSEIMYHPAPRTDGLNLEFVEIYNSNPWWDDISGYQLAGAVQYTFPTNTIIPGGGFLLVAAAPADMAGLYPSLTNLAGPYTGSLRKTGEIQLLDKMGSIFLDTTFTNVLPWPAGADGTGHSIVLARPSYGEADPRAWALSDVARGSPGTAETYRPSPLRNVVINEWLAHHDAGTAGYVELYNHGAAPVDVSGCVLTDDATTNKFTAPPGTILGAGGFAAFTESQLGFALKPAGGLILFRNPDGSRVEDAVNYEAQALNVSFGRWPDGAQAFYPLANQTPGGANGDIRLGDIVINEIMYKPISGDDDDQYLELYNKGTNTLHLGGWQFAAGISFVFPAGTVMKPGAYLVVAKNMAKLLVKYPNLNSGNTAGNFSGKLPHKGGRLALATTDSVVTTNNSGTQTTTTIYPVEDEVTYSTGGRWGQWAHGGGSSLELINPNTNHRLACNWADSDETGKSSWTNLVFTGLLDHGDNFSFTIDTVQVGLLDVGEALVDNLALQQGTNGTNLIANGDFEQGLANWTPEGDHVRSSLETASGLGGYQSARSLHLRSSDAIWTGVNSVQGLLDYNSLASGQTVTLSLTGRWLRGVPEVLLRLHGNWIELTGAFPVPTNLGTPGGPNSQAVASPSPAIFEVRHSPPIPPAGLPVVVTARFHDFNGFQPTLLYRIDTGTNLVPAYLSVPMVDDGTGGDALAGDGVYSATIPAQPSGTGVAFLVQAADPLTGASSVFPAVLNDNSGLPRECMVMFGDTVPAGTFGHFHLWMTQNWATRWTALGGLSNEDNDCTFVDGGGRIIYNMGGRYSGSPSHPELGAPTTHTSNQQWKMPADEPMLGATTFDKEHVPGNGPYLDNSLQREQTSYWMARQIGIRWNYRRYYVLYVNGLRYGALMEDTQIPNGDLVDEYWPNDNDGFLYKNSIEFEFASTLATLPFVEGSCCPMTEYTTIETGAPAVKLADYRWTYLMKASPDSLNNYTNVFAFISAANAYGSNSYYAGMEALVDTEEYMRMSALEHATGDGDSITSGQQQNMYTYMPLSGKMTWLKWDWNVGMGNGGWGPDGANLFTVSNLTTYPYTQDPNMIQFQAYPPYRRAYLRAFKELADGPMNITNVSPVLAAKYAAFVANGLAAAPYNVVDPGAHEGNVGSNGGFEDWIGTMHNSLLAALSSQGVDDAVFTATLLPDPTGLGPPSLAGSAPVEVKTITAGGQTLAVTWTTVTNWTAPMPAGLGTNSPMVQAFDLYGNSVAGALAAPVILPPTLNPIPNQTAPPGGTLFFTATAIDPNSPPQPLAFSLDPGAPAGASIDPVSGAFAWNVPAAPVVATNWITVRVTDAATPPLSAAQTVQVLVTPGANLITIQQTQIATNQILLTWTSQSGMIYYLQSTGDLTATNWTTMDGSVEATGATCSMADFFNPTNSPRFYRVFTLK